MNAESLLNSLLGLALDATDVIPGLSDLKPDLELALGILPEAQAAYKFFTSSKGQHAITELNQFLTYVQSPDGQEAIAHVRNLIAAAQPKRG